MLAGENRRSLPSAPDLRIARQHDRGLDRAAMDAVAHFLRRRTVHPARRSATSSWCTDQHADVARADPARPAIIAALLPPWLVTITSLRTPARATLSPIAVHCLQRDRRSTAFACPESRYARWKCRSVERAETWPERSGRQLCARAPDRPRAIRTSVSSGRCGPCCSVAASGSTAIQRAASLLAISAQWMSVQSRGGTVEVIARSVSLNGFAGLFCSLHPGISRRGTSRRHASIMGQNDRRSPTMNPAFFAASVNRRPAGAWWPPAPARRAADAGQGVVRNQLGRARPSMAASSRRSPTAPTRNTASTSPSCPGGPNANNRILLIAGKIDFFMSANTLQSFDAVANNVPVVAVAAIFQKDPQVFLTHPEAKDRQARGSQAADAVRLQGRHRRAISSG